MEEGQGDEGISSTVLHFLKEVAKRERKFEVWIGWFRAGGE